VHKQLGGGTRGYLSRPVFLAHASTSSQRQTGRPLTIINGAGNGCHGGAGGFLCRYRQVMTVRRGTPSRAAISGIPTRSSRSPMG
jgi:hypothetical protein